eukprot:TRINITY_DN9649_c0_g1_i3.p1 TRINITY_DN9649_c0_g1~~TRINITY_DN9649_c0_g1_i3.p1  ORF type:complete len:478 (-),score=69.04 TRINITY_DN9649_c0_g1_i3:60-1493(-)
MRMRASRRLLFLLSTLFIWCVCGGNTDVWTIQGNKLLKNGVHVNVQGVSLSCTEFDSPIDVNADGTYVCPMITQSRTSSPLLDALSQKWKAEIIRIPVNSQWYMWDLDTGYPAGPPGCEFASTWAGKPSAYGNYSSEGYRAWIDDHVTAVTKLGMVAMIDLHWSDMDGTACCDNGRDSCYQGCQQMMADHKSVKFWEYVATKYANRSDVWFELYNEPAYGLGTGNTSIPILVQGGTSQAQYKNGCPASPLNTFTFVGMQDLYNAVRYSANADNIVVVGGADWSFSWNGVLAGPRPPDPSMTWCWDNPCQRGCGIKQGWDYMIQESPRKEGYPAPVPWSKNRWGKNIIYNTHPYQAKGRQTPTPNEACSDWIDGAINGTGTWLCQESAGWEASFAFLTPYVPVIATELGPWEGFPCDGSYIGCQLEWFNQQMISFTPWAYWGNPAAQCDIYPTLVNPDWSPNGYGQAVQKIFNEKSVA